MSLALKKQKADLNINTGGGGRGGGKDIRKLSRQGALDDSSDEYEWN